MIDLTPLDVRKKRGDFRKLLRGYDPEEVDSFLDLVAERMEVLVKENLMLTERVERLGEQVQAQEGRETAVREALVTAQELRKDIHTQASKEAELLRREATGEAEHVKREAEREVERIVAEAERALRDRLGALEELERQRQKFLKAFRAMLERELDAVTVEEGRAPLEDVALDIDLSGGRRGEEEDTSQAGTEPADLDTTPEPEPEPEPEADAVAEEAEVMDVEAEWDSVIMDEDSEEPGEAEEAEEAGVQPTGDVGAEVEETAAGDPDDREVVDEETEPREANPPAGEGKPPEGEDVVSDPSELAGEEEADRKTDVHGVEAQEAIAEEVDMGGVDAEEGELEEMEDSEAVIEKRQAKEGSEDEPLWLSSLLNHQSRKDEE